MEKVKLTQEQADAIEFALTESEDFKDNPDRLFRDCIASHVSFHSELYALNNLDVVKLAKVLFVPNSYEVERQIKEGDWVHYDNGKNSNPRYVTRKVDRIDEFYCYFGKRKSMSINEVKHATEEQIKDGKSLVWWEKNHRNLWGLHIGDILTNGHEIKRFLGKNEDRKLVFAKNTDDCINGFDKEIFDIDHVKKYYKILCFAEDRKDVDHAE